MSQNERSRHEFPDGFPKVTLRLAREPDARLTVGEYVPLIEDDGAYRVVTAEACNDH